MELQHSFLYKCYDIVALLKDCNKLSTFSSRLIKQSELHPERHCPMKYRGDGFELLIEALFKLAPIDNRLGVSNYEPIEGSEDTGVDAIGLGTNGKPAAVQVKFRSDNTSLLTANQDHLMNFGYAAQNKYDVDIEDNHNMVIVTNAKAVHHFTNNEMFLKKLHVVHHDTLKAMLDNNMAFWNLLRSAIKEQLCDE